MRIHPRIAVAAVLAVAAWPAAAQAVESEGRGENVRPVKNIPYPNLNAPDEKNAGTDLEFATITVAPDPVAAGATPATPAVPGSAPAVPATPAPQSAAQKQSAKKAKAKKANKRCTVNRKLRGKAKRRAAARCKKINAKRRRAAKKVKARSANLRDAAPAQPGVQRTFSFAGSYGDGLQIIDVTDPEDSKLVATWNCGISQGDVQVFRREDLGKWFATFTHDDGYDFAADSQCAKDLKALGFDPEAVGGAGTYIADVTNPYEPKTVSFAPVEAGSHNQTVHPSGKWLYNSNSDLITSVQPAIEIIDLRDIAHPKPAGEVALKTFPGLGTESHDITFNKDGSRAYVAALSHGEILDATDPGKPVSIGTVVDPAINVWHQANEITIKDPVLGERHFMIAEDEVAGAIGTGQCPNGGVHVYDITGDLEKNPVKVGYWNIDDVGPTEDGVGYVIDDGGTCTAHVFQLHEKEQLMTIAYYNGGVRVVDLTGLVGVALGKEGIGMKQLGSYRFADSNTWAVKAPTVSRDGFYLYGNDHRRGFDVYKYTPAADGASTSKGTWMTPEQALARAQKLRSTVGIRLGAVCILPASQKKS